MDGVPIRGYYLSDAPYEGRPPIPIDTMDTVRLRPTRFLGMQRVYHLGEWFNTEQIVRFIANKEGGVHFDQTREHAWQRRLEVASQFFTMGNPDGLKERQLVETHSPKHAIRLVLRKEIGHLWTCLDIELLAAAQSLVSVCCNNQPIFEWEREEGAP